jgi:large subunit ribosomal protein L9
MKIIFLQDVPNVAKAGEIKEVADGYGRNFLIPQKLAVRATPLAISTIEAQRRTVERSQAQTEAEMKELAQQLEEKEIVLKAKTGASDRLFGSITSADIASELQNATGLVVDKKKIELAEPIRHLGSYEIVLKLAKDISSTIKITIEKEEAG